MSDKTAKMMERVRALLAKAASTNFPAEAETFRQKADEIMTEYAIEQWMLEGLEKGRERPEPARRDFDFSWWRGNPFRSQLWSLFTSTARHCRCTVATTHADYGQMKMPVFGIPSDLDWFDVLFTSLMNQMIQQVDPQPKTSLTMNENLAIMREAGMPWQQAIPRIIALGRVADKEWDPETTTFDDVYKPWVHGYRNWCRRTGHSQSYVNQQTFRKHFADGFSLEINSRLRRMREETETSYDATHAAGSMDLVVRDIRAQVLEAMYQAFPDLRPHPADCDCDSCHFCRDPKCQRRACVEARKPIRFRSSAGPKIDHAAREAGREAGRRAQITNNPSERIGGRRELDK